MEDRPTECPLCGASMRVKYRLPHIWHMPAGSRPYRVAWCDGCAYGTLAPRPDPEELRTFYDESYFTRYAGESPEAHQGLGDGRVEPPGLLDKVRQHLGWRLDRGRVVDAPMVHRALGGVASRICDAGCGNGELLGRLRDLGHRVEGIELDPRAVERARQSGLTVRQGSLEELPEEAEPGGFDAVVMTHVLEHILDPVRALRNAAGLLRPGGALIVEVPNNEAILADRAGPSWFFGDAGRHVNFFTAGSLAATARRAGLATDATTFGGYCHAFSNDRRAAEGAAHDLLYAGIDPGDRDGSRRISRGRQWRSLALSALAPPRLKYEVVVLVARREDRGEGRRYTEIGSIAEAAEAPLRPGQE